MSIEDNIRRALSDTALRPSDVQRPGTASKRKRLSAFERRRMERRKRARDYAPGGKFENNFVNRLFPGINDKFSLLSNDQLKNWYESRGLERNKFSSIGNVVKTFFGGQDDAADQPTVDVPIPMPKPDDLIPIDFPIPVLKPENFGLSNPNRQPGMSFDAPRPVTRDQSRIPSVFSQFVDVPTLTAGVADPRPGQPPIGAGAVPSMQMLPTLTQGLLGQINNELGLIGNLPTPQPRVSPIAFAPFNDISGLLAAENIGQQSMMNYSQPIDFRLQVGSFGDENIDDALLARIAENQLLQQYNPEINRNLPSSTLLNPIAAAAFDRTGGILGAEPQIQTTGRFTAFTPGTIGVDEVDLRNLSGSQMMDYDRRLRELQAAAADAQAIAQQANPQAQFNLLGLY